MTGAWRNAWRGAFCTRGLRRSAYPRTAPAISQVTDVSVALSSMSTNVIPRISETAPM